MNERKCGMQVGKNTNFSFSQYHILGAFNPCRQLMIDFNLTDDIMTLNEFYESWTTLLLNPYLTMDNENVV